MGFALINPSYTECNIVGWVERSEAYRLQFLTPRREK